jgi:hypothetical protein
MQQGLNIIWPSHLEAYPRIVAGVFCHGKLLSVAFRPASTECSVTPPWNLPRSPLRRSLSPTRPERSEASVSPAGTRLAIAGDHNFVPARDASNGQELLTRSGHILRPRGLRSGSLETSPPSLSALMVSCWPALGQTEKPSSWTSGPGWDGENVPAADSTWPLGLLHLARGSLSRQCFRQDQAGHSRRLIISQGTLLAANNRQWARVSLPTIDKVSAPPHLLRVSLTSRFSKRLGSARSCTSKSRMPCLQPSTASPAPS